MTFVQDSADDRSPIRAEVDRLNDKELATCQGPTKVYFAQDLPGTTAAGVRLSRKETTKRLNGETRFPQKLDLRLGAQVLLIMVGLPPVRRA
jgi:ATP-dependent DNA helicase PIF1